MLLFVIYLKALWSLECVYHFNVPNAQQVQYECIWCFNYIIFRNRIEKLRTTVQHGWKLTHVFNFGYKLNFFVYFLCFGQELSWVELSISFERVCVHGSTCRCLHSLCVWMRLRRTKTCLLRAHTQASSVNVAKLNGIPRNQSFNALIWSENYPLHSNWWKKLFKFFL